MSTCQLLLPLETLKAQSSRTTMSMGHLLLLLKTLKAQGLDHLLLLQVLELQDTKGKRSASPPAKDKELHDTTGKSPPPPLAQDLNLHPSTEQLELLPNTDRETHKPLPSTQHSVFNATKYSSSSDFFLSRQKV
jgi:hypothetical protein